MKDTQMRVVLHIIEKYQHPDTFMSTREDQLNSVTAVYRAIALSERSDAGVLGRYWFWYWRHSFNDHSFNKLWEEMATLGLFTWDSSPHGRCYCLTEKGYLFIRPWYSRTWTFVKENVRLEVGIVGSALGYLAGKADLIGHALKWFVK